MKWAKSLVASGQNVMVNAPAGYGKSHLITNVLKAKLYAVHKRKGTVWMTASTSLSALAIDGTTIHSAASLQRGLGDVQQLIRAMGTRQKQRWADVKVVVIEECSILSARFFDLLDAVAQEMKSDSRVFRGVQVILLGDIFQLKPMPDLVPNTDAQAGVKYRKAKAQYCFDSAVFGKAHFQFYTMKHSWRCDAKGRLGVFLNQLRKGPHLDEGMLDELDALLMNNVVDKARATVFCCRKKDAAHCESHFSR